ncbi:hypothetical protein AMECASPLE_015894 [Ameca splendens]|uniref:Uncharacterized protein n=1 Tax=Ameca splendens TaxID=208324 RepID=A0ABV0YE36_9TELE
MDEWMFSWRRRRPWRSARSLPAQCLCFLTGSRERTRSHEELSSRCNLWQLEMDSDSGVALQPSHTVGHGGAGAYLQQSTGETQVTPWIGRQSIAGQHRDIQDKK